MKKLGLILIIFSIFPSTSFAYDALTPKEDAYSLLPNSNFLLKEDYKKFCEAEPLRIEKEIGTVIELYKGAQEIRNLEVLYREQQDVSAKCNETRQKIETRVSPTLEQNRLFGCGPDYVKRGGVCITPTAACQMYFGQEVSGVKSKSDVEVVECTCKTNYSFEGGFCVAQTSTNKASAVLGLNTVQTDAQLREVIAQLTAQVAALMVQLNARLGR